MTLTGVHIKEVSPPEDEKGEDRDEAAYLVGILNASALTEAFEEARTSGRHFQKSLWPKVPIPKFNKDRLLHRSITEVTRRAETLASTVLSVQEYGGQVALSRRIREALISEGIMDELDELVCKLLPEHIRIQE